MNKGYLAIVITIILWAWAVIFIKVLSFYLDPITQNFYRYLSATCFLIILSRFRNAKCLTEVPSFKILLIPSSFVFMFQTLTVYGLYCTSPTIAALIMRMNAVFINILAYFLVREERWIITSRIFLIGLLFALAGASGLILRVERSINLDMGALLVFAGTLFWASYVVTIRILIKRADPLKLIVRVFTLSSAMFLLFTIILGEITEPLILNWEINLLLLGSGILCVGLGNFMNYIALKELGASITSSLQLLIPLLTAIFSYIIFNEVITLTQIMYGFLLLLGCSIIIKEATRK